MGLHGTFEKINSYAELLLDSMRIHDVSPSQMVTKDDQAKQYRRKKSFTDELPFIDYLADERMFLLEDCYSVAAGFEFRTVNTEGLPAKSLANLRDKTMRVIESCIPTKKFNPWVVQVFFSNTYSLQSTVKDAFEFKTKYTAAKESDPLKEVFNELYKEHLNGVAGENGIFTDTQVTNQPFGGKETLGRIVIYKKSEQKKKKNAVTSPVEELSIVRDKFFAQLKKLTPSGVDVSIIDGKKYYEWMFRWLNPSPEITNGDVNEALNRFPYPGDEDVPVGRDFSALLNLSTPKSNVKNGSWNFDGMAHKFMSVENMRNVPKIGALSSPKDGSCIFDALPAGCMFSMTIIMLDKEVIRDQIAKVKKKAVGDGVEAEVARDEADIAERAIVGNNGIYPVEMGFYVRGKDEDGLRKVKNTVIELAGEAGLQIINDEDDDLACDSYLKNLPGNYRWALNESRKRTIKLTLQHIANLFPINGRGRGTGTPVQVQFNRGGEPMCFCTLKDRVANSHKIMIGSTGAGKSAKLVEETLAYVAQHDARVFIIEKGESFKGMVSYLGAKGRKVTSLKLAKGNNAIIPPYANAYKALVEEEKLEELINKPTSTMDDESASLPLESLDEPVDSEGGIEIDINASEEDEDEKDYLGEMELLTRIIVTGGDAERNKELSISDQAIIRRAIINAAKVCRDRGDPHPLPQDVAEAMQKMVREETDLREKQKDNLSEFCQAMNFFCTGLAGELFNRHGTLWPESDVMHIDLGDVTRDGKQAELAVAYASILNNINDIAERDQYLGRPIIVITDEGHNIVSKTSKASPILVPAAVKIVKMWRKLNAWYWIATQNIGDFSEEAGSLLKLCEWWEVLTVEPGEDEEIAKFKKLTDDQKSILSSVTKEDKKYSEGFVMCRNKRLNNQLFRSIPPSLVLVLGWSDPNEKAFIKETSEKHGVSYQAAMEIIAADMNRARGITS